MPVYVDSPLTVKITDIFKLHPECFDTETRALLRGNDSPFEFDDLRYIEDVEASKAVSSSGQPAIVISSNAKTTDRTLGMIRPKSRATGPASAVTNSARKLPMFDAA